MRTKLLLAATMSATLLAGSAFAASGAATGAVTGAVGGAVVGGPIGAAVGAVGGAIVGAVVEPPERVVTYVQEQPMGNPVVVEKRVVVGDPLPDTVIVTTIPDDPEYAYAVVNQQRVIVDTRSNRIVKFLD